MKIPILILALIVLTLESLSLANGPAILGGIRNGTALGVVLEVDSFYYTNLRLGLEANTPNDPGIVFIGGKWFLSDLNSRYPTFLSSGLVGYLSNSSSEIGPFVAVIWEGFLDVPPLFLELGVDVVKSGIVELQLGYNF